MKAERISLVKTQTNAILSQAANATSLLYNVLLNRPRETSKHMTYLKINRVKA